MNYLLLGEPMTSEAIKEKMQHVDGVMIGGVDLTMDTFVGLSIIVKHTLQLFKLSS